MSNVKVIPYQPHYSTEEFIKERTRLWNRMILCNPEERRKRLIELLDFLREHPKCLNNDVSYKNNLKQWLSNNWLINQEEYEEFYKQIFE